MIFKVFGTQNCLMVALVVSSMFARNAMIFRIQDMFMISDFEVSSKVILRQLNFGVLSI